MWLRDLTSKFKTEAFDTIFQKEKVSDISFGHSYCFQNMLLPVVRILFKSLDQKELDRFVCSFGLKILSTSRVKDCHTEEEALCYVLTYQEAIDDALKEKEGNIKKYYVSWNSVADFVKAVAANVEKKGLTPSGIYGIPRGGLCIAAMLSHRMDLPLLLAPAKNCIIVDDIADSGKTLIHYTKNDTQFNDYYIATMFYAKRSIVRPNFYAKEKTDKWIVFPWEEL